MAKKKRVWKTIKQKDIETEAGVIVQVKLIELEDEKNPVKMIALNKLFRSVAIPIEMKDELIAAIKEVSR
jgi:hypothetical protein